MWDRAGALPVPGVPNSHSARRAVQQAALDVEPSPGLPAWPKQPPDQHVALRAALSRGQAGLAGLGQARKTGPGRWVA